MGILPWYSPLIFRLIVSIARHTQIDETWNVVKLQGGHDSQDPSHKSCRKIKQRHSQKTKQRQPSPQSNRRAVGDIQQATGNSANPVTTDARVQWQGGKGRQADVVWTCRQAWSAGRCLVQKCCGTMTQGAGLETEQPQPGAKIKKKEQSINTQQAEAENTQKGGYSRAAGPKAP